MADWLGLLEEIARRAPQYTGRRPAPKSRHPFDLRDIHPRVSEKALPLFDDGHFAQATFEVFKLIEKEVQQTSKLKKSGMSLMMAAFSEKSPKIRLNEMSSPTDADEQHGFRFLFAGAMLAIRNRRGHEVGVAESSLECLDHLSLASLLLRRLDAAQRVV